MDDGKTNTTSLYLEEPPNVAIASRLKSKEEMGPQHSVLLFEDLIKTQRHLSSSTISLSTAASEAVQMKWVPKSGSQHQPEHKIRTLSGPKAKDFK